MISLALAMRLRMAGLRWEPATGDRFVIPQPELREEVFVLSDMTIEVHDFPTGPVIGFNGTTEWALDSVQQDGTVWLPSEAQLRERLGDRFRRLERDAGRHRVVLADGSEFTEDDPAEAYGLALLHALTAGR